MRFPLLLDDLQRRHPWLGFPVAVVYKFIDDHGVYLSVLITYYGFLALFPLILLLTSILGFVLDDEPAWREWILDTAVSQFPVIGTQISQEGLGGSTTAVVVGAIVALWGGIRASQATLHMMNIAWAVPRHERPDPLRSPIRALPLIAIAGLMLVGMTFGTVFATNAWAYGVHLQLMVPYLVLALSFVVAVLVFSLGMWVGTSYPVRWRQVLPGAIFAAVGWLLLQRFGVTYANQIVSRAGDTYGVFAFVLGLIAFLFAAAQIVVLAVEINVVRVKKLWPRALLGPFTSSVPLTPADVQTYRDATVSTVIKDYQEVEVSFEHEVAERVDGERADVVSADRERVDEESADGERADAVAPQERESSSEERPGGGP